MSKGYTKVDTALLDSILPLLKPSVRSVFEYILRRSIGFSRGSAVIPYRQFVEGLWVKGVQVDHGAMVSIGSAKMSVMGLEALGLITVIRNGRASEYTPEINERVIESVVRSSKIPTFRSSKISPFRSSKICTIASPVSLLYIERKNRKKVEKEKQPHPQNSSKTSLNPDFKQVQTNRRLMTGGAAKSVNPYPIVYRNSGECDMNETSLPREYQSVVTSRWRRMRGAKRLSKQDASRIFSFLEKYDVQEDKFIEAVEGYEEHKSGVPDIGEFISSFWGWHGMADSGDSSPVAELEAPETHRETPDSNLTPQCTFDPIEIWEQTVAPLTLPWNPRRDDPRGRVKMLCSDPEFVANFQSVCQKCATMLEIRKPEWLTLRWLMGEKAGKDNWWRIYSGEMDWLTRKEKMSAMEEFFSKDD